MKTLKLLLMLMLLTACTQSSEIPDNDTSLAKAVTQPLKETIKMNDKVLTNSTAYTKVKNKQQSKQDVVTKTDNDNSDQATKTKNNVSKESIPKDQVVKENKESVIKSNDTNKPTVKPKPTPPSPPALTTPEKPPAVIPPKDEVITKACPNAWYDEDKACDFIPSNLLPTDESGRGVPSFNSSQEAWNWGENEINNDNSTYGCRGFTRMDGYYNDGRQFFFAYIKVCDQ